MAVVQLKAQFKSKVLLHRDAIGHVLYINGKWSMMGSKIFSHADTFVTYSVLSCWSNAPFVSLCFSDIVTLCSGQIQSITWVSKNWLRSNTLMYLRVFHQTKNKYFKSLSLSDKITE